MKQKIKNKRKAGGVRSAYDTKINRFGDAKKSLAEIKKAERAAKQYMESGGYRSKYQLGGVPVDTTLTPIQRGQQSGLLSNPQNIMQQFNARQNAKMNQASFRQNQMQIREQNLLNRQDTMATPVRQLGPQMFQGGGLPNWLYKARGKAMRKKMQGGGMYADNTVQAAGQGVPGSTANIVFQESDPRLQEQRLASLTAEQDRLQQLGITAAEEVKQMEVEGKESILQAEQEAKAQGAMVTTGVKVGMEGAKQLGLLKGASTTGKGLKTALNAYKMQRAANLAGKAQVGIKAGLQTAKQAQQGAQALKLASQAGGSLPVGVAAPSSVTALAEGAKGTGSALGAGIAQAAKNPNVIAAAANIAGKTISHYASDDDATTWTTGEATGDILGTAGEYAGYGAMLGSVIPGVGNVVGAVGGAVIGAGKAVWTGLAGRKKARLAKREYEAKKKAKIGKYNKETRQAFGSQLARVRAGELAQKTYSGYDLGRNVVAQMGGMRMGMPRYGYAA